MIWKKDISLINSSSTSRSIYHKLHASWLVLFPLRQGIWKNTQIGPTLSYTWYLYTYYIFINACKFLCHKKNTSTTLFLKFNMNNWFLFIRFFDSFSCIKFIENVEVINIITWKLYNKHNYRDSWPSCRSLYIINKGPRFLYITNQEYIWKVCIKMIC